MPSWRINDEALLVGHWPLNGASGGITPDVSGHGYHGTLVNTPTFAPGPQGRQCIELDGGTKHVNIGDVVELNAVEKFSICFWMNQDVLDVVDNIFRKVVDATNGLIITTSADGAGLLYTRINNGVGAYGRFDYSAVISANSWHHFAAVFDGSQAANASRLVVYVDGAPVVLDFAATTIPAATSDLSGADATIGAAASSFDGKLYDFRIASCAYSRDEIISIIHGPIPFAA